MPLDDDDCLKLAHREIAMFCEKCFERTTPMIKIPAALFPEVTIEGIPDNAISNLLNTLLQMTVDVGDSI